MAWLTKYLLSDGTIQGLWSASYAALLTAQIVEDDPTYGYLLVDEDIADTATLQQSYEFTDGVLTRKTEIAIVASSLVFLADGLDECTVTVDPFVESTLTVNGMAVAITAGDPSVMLTADTPQLFTIRLALMSGYWAEPLSLSAISATVDASLLTSQEDASLEATGAA